MQSKVTEGTLRRVFVSTAFWSASFSLVMVALPFRFQALGLSIVQYGVTLAVYALGMLITETLWGAVAFQIAGPRYIISFGAVVLGATLLFGFAENFLEFLLAAGLYGAFGVYLAPLMRWIALTAGGPGTAGVGTGRFGTFLGAGLVAGTSVGPILYVELGFKAVVLASFWSFGASLLIVMLLPWALFGIPNISSRLRHQFRGVLTQDFALAGLLVCLYFITVPLTSNFLQYYSVELFHGSPAWSGYVLGAARFTTLAASFQLGTVVDRWGAGRSAPLGFVLLAVGALGTLYAPSYALMVVATLVFSAGSGWLTASLLPLALHPIGRPFQGTAIGLFGSFEDLGLLLGPLLIGGLWAAYGVRSVFPVIGLVAVLAALLSFLVARRRTPTPAANPDAIALARTVGSARE